MTKTIFISIALLVVCWGIPNPEMSPTSFVARCCVLLWIFHKKWYISLSGPCQLHRQIEEEVEVRHIPHLIDGDPRSLGFVNIGSRQHIRSAATAWVPQVICLCSFDSHVLKKVLYKYNDVFFFSREIWYQKTYLLMFLHIGRQSRLPGGAGGDRCWTNSRVEQGRRRERGLVNWFDV